jgi:hypothetical protein
MPEYRAHLAGPAALIVEFGKQGDQKFGKWEWALDERPAEVVQNNIASTTEAAG